MPWPQICGHPGHTSTVVEGQAADRLRSSSESPQHSSVSIFWADSGVGEGGERGWSGRAADRQAGDTTTSTSLGFPTLRSHHRQREGRSLLHLPCGTPPSPARSQQDTYRTTWNRGGGSSIPTLLISEETPSVSRRIGHLPGSSTCFSVCRRFPWVPGSWGVFMWTRAEWSQAWRPASAATIQGPPLHSPMRVSHDPCHMSYPTAPAFQEESPLVVGYSPLDAPLPRLLGGGHRCRAPVFLSDGVSVWLWYPADAGLPE